MARVVLFGNGQVASMNAFYLRHDSPHEVVAFTVDGAHVKEDRFEGLPVVAFEEVERAFPPSGHDLAAPLGFRDVNRFREERFRRAKGKGYRFISYVSSKATTWPGLELGENCFIYEDVTIQCYGRVGDNTMICPSCTINHHARIGSHCFLASRTCLLGEVTVGDYCILGGNVTVKDGLTLGRACIVGAGATITRNIREKEVYAPHAAERLPKNSDELAGLLTWL